MSVFQPEVFDDVSFDQRKPVLRESAYDATASRAWKLRQPFGRPEVGAGLGELVQLIGVDPGWILVQAEVSLQLPGNLDRLFGNAGGLCDMPMAYASVTDAMIFFVASRESQRYS